MSFKFSNIGQFRNVIQNVKHQARFVGLDADGNPTYNGTKRLPKIRFSVTPKIHGTNAGIQLSVKSGNLNFNSRERILTLAEDNAGFMLYMSQYEDELKELFRSIRYQFPQGTPEKIVIYGEWCGGNIQKGVAVTGLEKMFVIFNVKYIYDENNEEYLPFTKLGRLENKNIRIYDIREFDFQTIDIDFENPQLSQNKLVEMCLAVEDECPVGKYFGRVKGTDNTTGEGVVAVAMELLDNPLDYPNLKLQDSGLFFKVKGEKHSVSKVKTLAAVDTEALESLNKFVEYAVTENRMEQMLQKLQNELMKPFAMESMGEFIRLVYQDVTKEETDTIIANQLDPKKLGGPIANVARKWFIEKFNSQV